MEKQKPSELMFGISSTGIFITELSLLATTKGGVSVYVDLGNHVFIHTIGWDQNKEQFVGNHGFAYFKTPEEADHYITERSSKAIKYATQRREARNKK